MNGMRCDWPIPRFVRVHEMEMGLFVRVHEMGLDREYWVLRVTDPRFVRVHDGTQRTYKVRSDDPRFVRVHKIQRP